MTTPSQPPRAGTPTPLGGGGIISADGTLIGYQGNNFYKACGHIVTGVAGGTSSTCVKRLGHPGTVHEDFDGNTVDVTDIDFTNATLDDAVTQAIGMASMCWQNVAAAGTFDDQRAASISNALLKRIREAGPIYG